MRSATLLFLLPLVTCFTINPLPELEFSWTIDEAAGTMTAEMTLTGRAAWFSLALSETPPHGMVHADFLVAMHNTNYTGVFDLFRPDSIEGYPCWDILHDCSNNDTAGTLDIFDTSITREGNQTTASFVRPLVTNDWKDWPIVKEGNHVLFAIGVDDWFTMHTFTDIKQGTLNFFTGAYAPSQRAPHKPRVQKPTTPSSSHATPLASSSPIVTQAQRPVAGQEPVTVTLPANACVRCRADYGGVCHSANVSCTVDGQAVEQLWTTSLCQGPPSSTRVVPAFHVQCPSPEMYSPWSVDLDRFVGKLQKDHPDLFPSPTVALTAIEEYRKMLALAQRSPLAPIVPSPLVDQVWHAHILDTRAYEVDCGALFGRFMHHAPSFGEDETEKATLRKQYEEMILTLEAAFGPVDASIWSLPGDQNCCMALCVKPSLSLIHI